MRKPMLVRELRKKAALCRRAASISTLGAGKTDYIPLELAEQLEREVALATQLLGHEAAALAVQKRPGHEHQGIT
jgi:hypothetical protein